LHGKGIGRVGYQYDLLHSANDVFDGVIDNWFVMVSSVKIIGNHHGIVIVESAINAFFIVVGIRKLGFNHAT
jgi:hypothetical protein